MSEEDSLRSLEQRAHRRAHADGIIDLFVGVSLAWIGAVWIWFPEYGGLAGIFPAVLTPAAVKARKQFVEKRFGYVRWSAPRRDRERRNLVAVFVAGALLFLGAIAAFFVVDRSLADEDVTAFIAPGLLAWLLAVMTLPLAFVMAAWRLLPYAVVLGVGGLIASLKDLSPGWPILASGAVVAGAGLIMVIRFAGADRDSTAD